MVFITPLLGAAALLSGFAAGLPRPDSAINEPAVSAPNGTPITDTSSPQATAVSSSTMMSSSSSSGSNYGSSYGSSGSSGSNWGSSSSSYGSSGSSSWSGSSSSGNYGSSSGSGSSWGSSSGSSSPSYGSGSSNWGNQGYNDCVQQCVANYGGLPSPYTPTATSTNSGGSSGSGVTHTIIVAPSQGVLRYVPFATNASVGDTIKFMWGANNHTVTKSSELTPCNHTSDSPFTSGVQLKDFVFTQVVNDTNPTFFYCGVPNHCQKGMFGIINPPNALTASTSVMNMMPSLAAGSSDMAAMASYTNTQVGGNSMVSNWGNSIDMASLPEWSHQYIAENVMYTKTFLASNPEVLQKDGSIDLSASGTTPLMIPQDLSAALNSATPASSSVASDPASTAAASSASASSSAAANQNVKSGALSMSPSKVAVGVIAAFASFMML